MVLGSWRDYTSTFFFNKLKNAGGGRVELARKARSLYFRKSVCFLSWSLHLSLLLSPPPKPVAPFLTHGLPEGFFLLSGRSSFLQSQSACSCGIIRLLGFSLNLVGSLPWSIKCLEKSVSVNSAYINKPKVYSYGDHEHLKVAMDSINIRTSKSE